MNPEEPKLNPFTNPKSFLYNRLLQGFATRKRTKGSTTTASAKNAKVKKWRLKNKMAYISRRKNRIIAKNLHHKLKG